MKRILTALLAALVLLSAAGCSGLFDREYYVEGPFEAQADSAETGDAAEAISNYTALRRAILNLVTERVESAQLQFQNYEGSISKDISTACWEVKSSTAIGAFAVDYISYDLSRIVSYYQAEIRITYKRSEYQMSALENTQTLTAMRARLAQALRDGDTYLVLSLTAASLAADTVRAAIEQAYYGDPTLCPDLPVTDVSLYPDTGVSRIAEVTLDYGLDSESLAARRQELSEAIAAMLAAIAPEEADGEEPDGAVSDEPGEVSSAAAVERLRALCGYIDGVCVWDEEAGATAWDALTQQAASSEGMAMALAAGCQAIGVDCVIVSGRLDGEPHVWNIVTVDGVSCHIDVSRWEAGEENVFLVSDEALWGAYWWDTSEVPACPLGYGEEPVLEAAVSAEPSGESGDAAPENEENND